ncbi:MAG: class IV adenylate cyclase [Bryobacteraceae bacterium]
MASRRGNVETEIKLRIEDPRPIRRALARLGFAAIGRRALEINEVFDTPACHLRAAKKLLRLRSFRGRSVLTYKGPPAPGRHKSREELETEISSLTTMHAVLERLGYTVAWRYQKYRTEFRGKRGGGHVMIDETPIGNFVELEGPPQWIDRTARRLGFRPEDYITSSYGWLYLEFCKSRGIEPGHMVFAKASRKSTSRSRRKK